MRYTFPKLSLFLSIIFLALALFLFVFLYGKVEENNQVAQDIWQKWKTEDLRRSNLKRVEASIVKTTEARAELRSHFAESSNVVPFLDMIEQAGEAVGAATKVTGVDLAKDGSGLVVQTESTGSFESIYKFLKLLENSPYELEFRTVDIRNTTGGQWSASVEIKLLSFIK